MDQGTGSFKNILISLPPFKCMIDYLSKGLFVRPTKVYRNHSVQFLIKFNINFLPFS